MQSKNEQLPHNQARTQQPKKTWIEPELAILGVEGGTLNSVYEGTTFDGLNGTALDS